MASYSGVLLGENTAGYPGSSPRTSEGGYTPHFQAAAPQVTSAALQERKRYQEGGESVEKAEETHGVTLFEHQPAISMGAALQRGCQGHLPLQQFTWPAPSPPDSLLP